MIWQMIEDWFRGILTDGILSNLSGLFDSVNTEVGEIASQVGTTPAGWNAGIFNMIRSLSENVIVPIAGVIIVCFDIKELGTQLRKLGMLIVQDQVWNRVLCMSIGFQWYTLSNCSWQYNLSNFRVVQMDHSWQFIFIYCLLFY